MCGCCGLLAGVALAGPRPSRATAGLRRKNKKPPFRAAFLMLGKNQGASARCSSGSPDHGDVARSRRYRRFHTPLISIYVVFQFLGHVFSTKFSTARLSVLPFNLDCLAILVFLAICGLSDRPMRNSAPYLLVLRNTNSGTNFQKLLCTLAIKG